MIGRAKKGLHVLKCPVFIENIGGEQKSLHVLRCPGFSEKSVKSQKKVFAIRDKAPHFLRSPWLQPA